MKVFCINNTNSLTLEHITDGGYSSFNFEASINIEHGIFNAKNIDVHFLNFKDFINKFDAFITDRKITPILNGTYDSYIKFEGRKNNSIYISFCLGDAFSGYSKTVDFTLNGEFEINSEFLNNIYNKFKSLEKNA